MSPYRRTSCSAMRNARLTKSKPHTTKTPPVLLPRTQIFCKQQRPAEDPPANKRIVALSMKVFMRAWLRKMRGWILDRVAISQRIRRLSRPTERDSGGSTSPRRTRPIGKSRNSSRTLRMIESRGTSWLVRCLVNSTGMKHLLCRHWCLKEWKKSYQSHWHRKISCF